MVIDGDGYDHTKSAASHLLSRRHAHSSQTTTVAKVECGESAGFQNPAEPKLVDHFDSLATTKLTHPMTPVACWFADPWRIMVAFYGTPAQTSPYEVRLC